MRASPLLVNTTPARDGVADRAVAQDADRASPRRKVRAGVTRRGTRGPDTSAEQAKHDTRGIAGAPAVGPLCLHASFFVRSLRPGNLRLVSTCAEHVRGWGQQSVAAVGAQVEYLAQGVTLSDGSRLRVDDASNAHMPCDQPWRASGAHASLDANEGCPLPLCEALQTVLWNAWHEQHTHASDVGHADEARSGFVQALPDERRCTVLELGCGQGRDAMRLASAGHTVYALDRSHVAMRYAECSAVNDNVPLRLMTHDFSRKLPFQAESFDGVYAHLALHYFDEKTTQNIIDEIFRVLKPAGALYFTVRHCDDPLNGIGRELDKTRYCQAGHVRRFFDDAFVEHLMMRWNVEATETYFRSRESHREATNPGCFVKVLARRPAALTLVRASVGELVSVKDPIPTWKEDSDYFEWAAFQHASRFPCAALGPDALQQQALLADTEHFYVVPDQFGVVSGHLLVLPKQAASSMASLPADLDDEFTWLLAKVSETVAAEYDMQVIISEHGECGCATADQAHVHVIPIPKDVSREHLIAAISRALRRRMVGVSSVAYKDTVFTSAEDMRDLATHPSAVVNGTVTQYDDLCQAGGYPTSARSATGLARPYVYFKALGIEFTSTLSFKSQFAREVVADVAELPKGAWDRRVHVDRSNMFDTFRRLVGPFALTDRRCYGFRARADQHERDRMQPVTRVSTTAIG